MSGSLPAAGEVQNSMEGFEGSIFRPHFRWKCGPLMAQGKKIHIWHTPSGNLIRDIPVRWEQKDNETLQFCAAAFSHNGRQFVSAELVHPNQFSGSNWPLSPAIRLWDRASGQQLWRLEKTTTQTLAFSPDSRLIAAGHGRSYQLITDLHPDFEYVNLWDTLTGDLVAGFRGHRRVVQCVAFSPDGRNLATASADHSVLVWEVPYPVARPMPVATAKQLQAWWTDLAADAVTAQCAARRSGQPPAKANGAIARETPEGRAPSGHQTDRRTHRGYEQPTLRRATTSGPCPGENGRAGGVGLAKSVGEPSECGISATCGAVIGQIGRGTFATPVAGAAGDHRGWNGSATPKPGSCWRQWPKGHWRLAPPESRNFPLRALENRSSALE